MKAWHVELGQQVTQGQLLVEIDTPELDQELLQARADLTVARTAVNQAEAELREVGCDARPGQRGSHSITGRRRSRSTADFADAKPCSAKNAATADDLDTATRDHDARQADLSASEAAITRQAANLETRKAVIEARKSSVESQLANVRRLEQLQSFRRIEAPYDGVVTQRRVEVGNLVSATAAGEALYEVAQVDRVRVQVPVPQSEAAGVRIGTAVTVRIPERPGQEVSATVTRTSQSVNPTTRTLLAEIEIPNRDGLLSPGLYADVQFQTQAPEATWLVPSNTVRMQVDGPHVVVATDQGRLNVQSVRLGRDYGRHVAILEGVTGAEQLVVNPTDDLQTGMNVEVLRPARPLTWRRVDSEARHPERVITSGRGENHDCRISKQPDPSPRVTVAGRDRTFGRTARTLRSSGNSDAASRLDPTAAREANRDAIEFALQAGYSGFIRIPAVDSLDGGGEVYDSRHNQLPDARTLAESASVAGELSGDSGFTSDASQPVDQASRSLGPAGME